MRILALFGGLVVFFVSAPTLAQLEEREERNPRLGLRARADIEYTSNLFHTAERRIPDIPIDNANGERYYDLVGPWDMLTHAGLRGTSLWKLGHGRRLELLADADFVLPVRNTLARYFEFGASAHWRFTRRDHLSLDLSFIPDRFRKNYAATIAGTDAFGAAYYWQFVPILSYVRDLNKHWAMGVSYRFKLRRYSSLFTNHDQNANRWLLFSSHELSKHFELTFKGGAELILTPAGRESGVLKDRSLWGVLVSMEADWQATKAFSIGLSAAYRYRHYTTTERADDSHFDRTDHRVGLGANANLALGSGFSLYASGGWLRSYSNRIDPRYSAALAGYSEFTAGFGVQYAFMQSKHVRIEPEEDQDD